MEPTIHELRALFLREFMRHIIMNYPLSPELIAPILTFQPREEPALEQIRIVARPGTILERQVVKEPSINTAGRRLVVEEGEYSTVGPQMIVAIQEIDDANPAQASPSRDFLPSQAQPTQKAPLLDQLDRWLTDQTLESIECSGPDQKLIIRRAGSINQSTTQMTNDEIHSLINELSERAHVAIENGILKAETSAWSVLAVMSEFGGSRFLIQKKNKR